MLLALSATHFLEQILVQPFVHLKITNACLFVQLLLIYLGVLVLLSDDDPFVQLKIVDTYFAEIVLHKITWCQCL